MRPLEYLIDRLQGKAPKGAKRSSKWRKVRAQHLKENPRCFICESKKNVEVHHKLPFHVAPELEIEPSNLMSLCENKKYGINCHLLVGHLGNYRRTNITVVIDATTWNMKIKGR